MGVAERLANGLIDRRRVAIALVAILLVGVGAGVAQLEQDDSLQAFELGSTEEAKLDYVEANFSAGHPGDTVAQIVVRDDDVLDKETLRTVLDIQRRLAANETVAPTLAESRSTASVANVIATAAIQHRYPNLSDPTIDQQLAAIEALDRRQLNALLAAVLGDGSNATEDAFAFLPNHYEPGATTANATMIAVFQQSGAETPPANAPEPIVDAQVAMQTIATDATATEETMVVGAGIITAETEQSRTDTFAIVGPLALMFVLLTLLVVYRDLFDVALSLFGIVLVQVWTFGALGWLGIPFNTVLIAIPVLLVGLSIDYGIHVFMRYRERRERTEESVAASMQAALAGVGVALVWVTATTVVGFLSNVASPVAPIRELGLISAVGIVGALVVFGGLLPPLKVELEQLLGTIGLERRQRPIGTGSGRVAGLLSAGSGAARRAPVLVVILVLLVTAATTAGATQVSTTFEPEDNIADSAPEWTEHLPAELEPGEYTVKENRRYVNDHFVRHDAQAELLVEGDVTAPDALERVAQAEDAAGSSDVAVTLANGEARIASPLAVMQRVAAQNPSFREAFERADTDDDGVPDRNVEALYDALYATAPEQASQVLHRVDGEYRALRLSVSVAAGADGQAVTAAMADVETVLDGDGLRSTATGDPIVQQLIQDYLLETLLVSLFVTLLVVAGLLAAAYRLVHDSATLGLVTILPVAFVVSWIVATMYAIGYPLSVLTTLVASITVGIGIDYSIHVSERFRSELDAETTIGEAIATTTRGTGSALLGSAVTTATGFGVLGFALHPSLQQFGTITAVMIAYAFLASVLVLPSFLVLWARFAGLGATADRETVEPTGTVGSPGD